MIELSTDCEKCVHKKVCKNLNNAKYAKDKLCNTIYGDGPNDDYDWNIFMTQQNVNVVFSCPDYTPSRMESIKRKGEK